MDSRRLVIVISVILSLLSLVSCAPFERPLAAASPTPRVYLPTVTRAQRPSTAPTLTPSSTVSLSPTATHTAEPTSTATSIPGYTISGVVFFDYNGSGLREEGEPGIQDVPVCIDSLDSSLCSTTDADGWYSISNVPAGPHDVHVCSPTEDPATAFRYINRFLGWVDIQAYEMNGVQVPAQHLPDTEIQSIDQPLHVNLPSMVRLNVALMQGFLTLPFMREQVPQPFVWNYFDILNLATWPPDYTVNDARNGVMMNYDGSHDRPLTLQELQRLIGGELLSGVDDAHIGLDYRVDVGRFIVSMLPTSMAFYIKPGDAYGVDVHLMLADPESRGNPYSTNSSHLSTAVVQVDQRVHRGQIIGLSGSDSSNPQLLIPQVHVHLARSVPNGTLFIDPHRHTVVGPAPSPFAGSDNSYWTKDNDAQFPLVTLGE